MNPESLFRTMTFIRSLPGWRDEPCLREWHDRLAAEADEIQMHRVVDGVLERCHDIHDDGSVTVYATYSGHPAGRHNRRDDTR